MQNIYEQAYFGLPKDISPIAMVKSFLYNYAKETRRKGALALSEGCEMGTWERCLMTDTRLASYLPGLRVIGVDIDIEALNKAKELISLLSSDERTLAFVAGDAIALPFPDKLFNMVYSPLLQQWIPEPDRVQAIRESGRVLKDDGWLQIIVPGPKHLELELSFLPRFSDISEGELQEMKEQFFISKKGLRKYVRQAGLRVVQTLEVIKTMTTSSIRRVALVYADTLAPNIPHKDSYKEFLIGLQEPTCLHFVEILCRKEGAF